jgi:hypothetical protein
MKPRLVIQMTIMLLFSAGIAQAVTYDAAADFDTDNPNSVWTYGIRFADGTFVADNSTIDVGATTQSAGQVTHRDATVHAHYLSTLGAYSEEGSYPGLNIVGGNMTGSDLFVDCVDSYNATWPNRTLLRSGSVIIRSGQSKSGQPNYGGYSGDLRFTAPVAGDYNVDVEMYDAFVPRDAGTNGFSVNCLVSMNGLTLNSADVTGYVDANPYGAAGNTFTYSNTLSLAAGDKLDFCVRDHIGGQAAGAIITISTLATPEPGTLVLIGIGLFGMSAYAWRKRN